jgi:hypothetical protein
MGKRVSAVVVQWWPVVAQLHARTLRGGDETALVGADDELEQVADLAHALRPQTIGNRGDDGLAVDSPGPLPRC